MVAGRRGIGIHEASAWIFNRMADVYSARPPYPVPLLDAVGALGGGPGVARRSAGDIGAGIGHFALPLAGRGFDVVAVEPATAMLEQLRRSAAERGVALRAVHAAAEALPLPAGSLDLVLVADALHFMDAELAGRELARVLRADGALAVVTSELADTPFMRAVVAVMEAAAPRRPRAMSQAVTQVLALAGATPLPPRVFHDETPVDAERLERILGSISFIGPAMNPVRFAAFSRRIRELAGPRVWARTLTLHGGVRRGARAA